MKGSRVFAIIAIAAAVGGIGLALALKHQRAEIDARKRLETPIRATK